VAGENCTRSPFSSPLLVCAILLAAASTVGCSAGSNQRVTSMSIIALRPGANLVGDGGFEQSGLGAWTLRVGPRVAATIDRRIRFSGEGSLRFTASAQRAPTSIVLSQQVADLPDSGVGSRYVLRVRARTVGVSRPLETELKLNFAGGGYRFFRGLSTDGLPKRRRIGIPSGTSPGWIKIVVAAKARFPLQSIEAFVLDSGPGRLTGTVWIDQVELHAST
jgi:hypothetical protein